jgi:hypothetical protein
MRFVKFNFLDGDAFCFYLDDVVTIESSDEDTVVSLRNDRRQV